jgi:hypothetical protein
MKFFPCSLLLNDFALNLGFLVYRMEIPPTLKSSHRHSVAAIVTETSLIRKDVILSNVHYLPPRNPSDKECTMLLHQHQPRHDPLQIPQRPQTVCPKPQLQQNWNHVSKCSQRMHPTLDLVGFSPSACLLVHVGRRPPHKSVYSFSFFLFKIRNFFWKLKMEDDISLNNKMCG